MSREYSIWKISKYHTKGQEADETEELHEGPFQDFDEAADAVKTYNREANFTMDVDDKTTVKEYYQLRRIPRSQTKPKPQPKPQPKQKKKKVSLPMYEGRKRITISPPTKENGKCLEKTTPY